MLSSSCSDWDTGLFSTNNFYYDVNNNANSAKPLDGAATNCTYSGNSCEIENGTQQQYMTTSNQSYKTSSLLETLDDFNFIATTNEESVNFDTNINTNLTNKINTNAMANTVPYASNNSIILQNTNQNNNIYNNFQQNINQNNNYNNQNNKFFNQNNNNNNNIIKNTINCIQSSTQTNENYIFPTEGSNINLKNTSAFNQNNNNFAKNINNCSQFVNSCKQNNGTSNQNPCFENINNQINKGCNQNGNNFILNNNQFCYNKNSDENFIDINKSNCNNNFINPIIERHHPYRYNNPHNYQQQQQEQQMQQFSYHKLNSINQNHNFTISQHQHQYQPLVQTQEQFPLNHVQQQQSHAVLYNARALANSTPPPPLEQYTYQTFAPPPTFSHHAPISNTTDHMFMNNYYQNHHATKTHGQQQQQQQHLNVQLQQQQSHALSIPCQGNQPWTYAYCYGYGAYSDQGPCQFTQIVDIEDFMNNEKRKERSRDAARCRRSRETEIFTELAQELPLKKEDVQQLDKASVMRIAITYLKVRDMLKMFPRIQELLTDLEIPNNASTNSKAVNSDESSKNATNNDLNDSSTQTSNVSEESSTALVATDRKLTSQQSSTPNSVTATSIGVAEDFSLMLKHALDGFLLILSNDGDIIYVTANIADYLGISKIDILGQQIWEYAHQCDHAELKEALNIKRNGLVDKIKDENLLEEGISTDHRDLFVRLKCTLTSRGRSINIKSASYKVIHITGHLVVNTNGDRVLVAMGRPIPHPSNIEIPLGTTTFLTKHSLDMKFTYVDDKMFNLLGYKPEDLLETSLFNCHHGIDSDSLMTTFKNVVSKGQGETCRYRFLGKYGGYCWIVTQATIVYDKLKPQSVVCVNFVISNLEKENEIYTLQQYEESQKLKDIPKVTSKTSGNNRNAEIISENKTKNEKIIKENKTKEELQKQIITPDSEVSVTITKVENSTPPATPLNNNNNNNNKNNNKINADLNQLNTVIKKEQQKPTIVLTNNSDDNTNNKNQKTSPSSNTTPPVAKTPITATVAPTIFIPPTQQTLPSLCPTTTVTHTIFSKPKLPHKLNATTDDKGPKTVTSSLILSNLPTTTSTQSIIQQQPLNVATRAQSVTATVFSPLPQLPPKLPATTATAAVFTQIPQQTEGGQETEINTSQQQDMNKGFLSFAEDATELTMLKEEPDDLTAHLVATNAVDACMPLDESGPLFGEILVGFGMGSYGSLLPDDINSLDSNTSSTEQTNNNNSTGNISKQTTLKTSCNTNTYSSSSVSPTSLSTAYNGSSITVASTHRQSSPSLITTTTCATNGNTTLTTNSTNIDPFINYRDESNDTNCSQHLLSPSVTSKSPEGSSLPSLCSPNSLSQEDEFSYYTMNVDDMDDLTMRAPYIPMNEQDDLPLLTSDDYMWSSGNAFTPDEFSLQTKDSDNGLQAMQINQSLNYQQQQFTQQQTQQYTNSLCSSPASTVSSMSPSPIQQQNSSQIFSAADSSELATLLCGSGNGALSILQDTANFTNSLNLNGGGSRATVVNTGGNSSSQAIGAAENNVGLNDDLGSVNVASSTANATLDQHQQLQQQCLQQFQEQLQQQRQQQQLLSGININCKKEKFDTANNSPSMSPNLCDTIDNTFESVYSKNSTNLDCWNEFLQINTNENINTTNNAAAAIQQQGMDNLRQEDCKQQLQMQLQQQQQTQNIIINAVPLITIQTTTSANQQQQQQQQQQLQNNTKLLNKVNAIKLTPITSTATIKIIEHKEPLLQQQQQQQQQQQSNIIKTAYVQPIAGNNKRHLSTTQIANNALESKRLKSNNIMDLQNSKTSQLLQQLITLPQQQQENLNGNGNGKNTKVMANLRWSSNENQNQKQQQQQQQKQQHQKQSNSVLKNLLISGCDKSKTEVLAIDDSSRNSMQSPDLGLSTSMTRPLHCVTSPANLLRNYRHNPWIGGPGILPSPNSALIINEESNSTCMAPSDSIDSASDSGIDDISVAENMSPLKRAHEQQNNKLENIYGMTTMAATEIINNNDSIMDNNSTELENNKVQESIKTMAIRQEMGLNKNISNCDNEDDGVSLSKRKRSISFLDSSNPLMTPFLMDLCNDDYNMNAKEYLQENDIENVLNEWPVDLV